MVKSGEPLTLPVCGLVPESNPIVALHMPPLVLRSRPSNTIAASGVLSAPILADAVEVRPWFLRAPFSALLSIPVCPIQMTALRQL